MEGAAPDAAEKNDENFRVAGALLRPAPCLAAAAPAAARRPSAHPHLPTRRAAAPAAPAAPLAGRVRRARRAGRAIPVSTNVAVTLLLLGVAVRVRPLNARETSSSAKNAWKVKKNMISTSESRDVSLHFGAAAQPRARLASPSRADTSPPRLDADNLFGVKSTTSEVYEAMAKDVVVSAMEGIHGEPRGRPARCRSALNTRCGQARFSPTGRPAAGRRTQ